MSYQATWTFVLDGAHVAAGTCGSLPLGSAAAALLRPLAASLEALMLGASAAVILHEHACAARDGASALSPQGFQMLHLLLGYEGMSPVELGVARPAQALPAPAPATAPTSSSPPNLRTEPLGDHVGDLGSACSGGSCGPTCHADPDCRTPALKNEVAECRLVRRLASFG